MARRTFADEPLPSRLLFDTSFLVDLVVATQPRHDPAAAFFDRVVRARPEVICIVSSLVYPEFANAVARLFLISDLGLSSEEAQAHLRQRGPLEVADRVAAAMDALEDALSYPEEMFQVRLDLERWTEALALSLRVGLQPYDSIHAAAAFHARSADIVSFDWSFDKIPELNRWAL